MMSVGPLIGIIVLILVLIIVSCGFWYIFIIPPHPPPPTAPLIAMDRDVDSPNYSLRIVSLSGSAKISDVGVYIIHMKNGSASRFDLEDITKRHQTNNSMHITYYDCTNVGKLSVGDSLILKID